MRRFLPAVVLIAGCAGVSEFQAEEATLSNAERHERELKRNLRDDRSWKEHERQISDLKATISGTSNADALGPNQTNPAQ